MNTLGKPKFTRRTPQKKVDLTKDIVKATNNLYDITLDKIRQRGEQEKNKFYDETTSDYYVCLVFRNADQKSEFMKKVSKEYEGDEDFINGVDFGKNIGVDVSEVGKHFTPKLRKKEY